MFRRATSPAWLAARVFLAVALLLVGVAATPALATEAASEAPEEEGPAPGIDEIGTSNEVSNQYKPEAAEPPPFMRFLYIPLTIVGVLMAALLLLQYLRWQPRFAAERRSKRRR